MIRRYRKKTNVTLELAPIIDIVFILLIFFAVSSSLVSQNEGIPVDLPAAASSETQDTGITISVTKDQRIYIDRNEITLAKLPQFITNATKENQNLEIIFNAHKTLDYETVINILDTIRLAGGTNLSLQIEKVIKQSS